MTAILTLISLFGEVYFAGNNATTEGHILGV